QTGDEVTGDHGVVLDHQVMRRLGVVAEKCSAAGAPPGIRAVIPHQGRFPVEAAFELGDEAGPLGVGHDRSRHTDGHACLRRASAGTVTVRPPCRDQSISSADPVCMVWAIRPAPWPISEAMSSRWSTREGWVYQVRQPWMSR